MRKQQGTQPGYKPCSLLRLAVQAHHQRLQQCCRVCNPQLRHTVGNYTIVLHCGSGDERSKFLRAPPQGSSMRRPGHRSLQLETPTRQAGVQGSVVPHGQRLGERDSSGGRHVFRFLGEPIRRLCCELKGN